MNPINQETTSSYQIHIRPNKSWHHMNWHAIWEYRDLLFLLVRRDFVSKYKQTILGPLWFILQPLATTIVFTVVFSRVARIPTDSIPPMLFYLCGLIGWMYFANCLNYTSTTFVTNAGIFNKVYFPRLIIPFSVIISRFLAFIIQFVMFIGFYIFYKFFTPASDTFHLNPAALIFFPLLIMLTALLGLGMGLWLSALTAKYRDLTQLTTFLTSLWMYATPVIYPLSLIPAKWHKVMALNPMAGIVEAYRYCFFSVTVGNLFFYMLSSIIMTLIILISGILIFNKTERNFIDTI
ncbi:MAG: ABC transporter permease [Candidatus Omnitrophica bacterium]|nr:ABC transporter permease [Candidatus Omnitrophota bacterium]